MAKRGKRKEAPGPRVYVPLLPKQFEFISSEAPCILYSGAFGAGKSRALCYRAMRLAEHPAARVGLCRKALSFLKNTTLKTLLERDGDLPPVLPANSYIYRKTPGEFSIRLNGGGEIMPFGFDDPTRVGSMNFSDVCVDEGIELEREEWDMLSGRARVQFTMADGTPNKRTVAVATNPGGPDHFLYRLFHGRGGEDYHLIETTTAENWYLPRDYVKRLSQTLYGPARDRYLKGVWCAYEGAVFQMFDMKRHCVPWHDNWTQYVAGIDIGFSHPSVVRVHGVNSERWHHVVAEFHQASKTTGDIVEVCKQAALAYSPITFVFDPARPDMGEELMRAGLFSEPGINDREAGISAVQNALSMVNAQGIPRLTMEPGLQGNMEYLSYRWKPSESGREDVVKKNDDAVDADRYATMKINQLSFIGRLFVLDSPVRDPVDRLFDDALKEHRREMFLSAAWSN